MKSRKIFKIILILIAICSILIGYFCNEQITIKSQIWYFFTIISEVCTPILIAFYINENINRVSDSIEKLSIKNNNQKSIFGLFNANDKISQITAYLIFAIKTYYEVNKLDNNILIIFKKFNCNEIFINVNFESGFNITELFKKIFEQELYDIEHILDYHKSFLCSTLSELGKEKIQIPENIEWAYEIEINKVSSLYQKLMTIKYFLDLIKN